MKTLLKFAFLFCTVLSFGCQPSTDVANVSTDAPAGMQSVKLVAQVVEAACGECKFGMEGDSCDLAVRIDGKGFFVDGSKMSDHGNAHGADGMCNTIRKARVTGEVKDGRFVAASFELLPENGESASHESVLQDQSALN